jgi:glycosyltransferase involved in cell wall biosynthesis
MKLLIDLQGAQTQSRHRGIGRYTRELAKAFITQADGHEVHLALNSALDEDGSDAAIAEFAPMLPRERIHYLRLPYGTAEHRPDEGAWRRVAAARLMRHAQEALQPDVVWHTSVFEGMTEDAIVPDTSSSRYASAATLYDLIPLHDDVLHLPNAAARDWYARRLEFLRGCELLLAISEWTRRDAIERLDLEGDRVVVVGGAVDSVFRPPSEAAGAIVLAKGITRPFVLYNGGLDPRKNVTALVQAFARLPPALREAHQLVLVGKGEAEQRELARLATKLGIPRDALLLPGFVPDQELVALYGTCALFVFPSRFEGFGLPPLEAMACGAPVLCSHATSLPEVVGRAEALFDPDDTGQLCARMTAALTDPGFAQALRDDGRRRAAGMTWETVATRALAGFEALHARRNATSRVLCVAGYDEGPPDVATPGADADAQVAPNESALLAELAALDGTATPDDLAQVAVGIVSSRTRSDACRWLVDVTGIAGRDLGTGIQQVVRNVLRQWLLAPPAGVRIEPVRFDAGHVRHARAYARQLVGSIAPDGDDTFAMARHDDVFVGLDWSFEALPAARPRLGDWRRGGTRTCFVVYDLLPVTSPQYFHPHTGELYARWLHDAAYLADRFACISRATASALTSWLDANAPGGGQFGRRAAVQAFPLGSAAHATDNPHALRLSLRTVLAARPTLLMVGTLEPRKGHADGLDACEALWRSGVDANLVIAGRRGWMSDALAARLKRHPERDQRMFWHEDVDDAELQALYAGSTALLALSHGEGYGLPLVEAARHGLPVFARDLPVFREILGDYPRFLTDDVAGWPAVLAECLAASRGRCTPPLLPGWSDSARALEAIVRGTLLD